jgi:type IV secretory pathway VirB10-like protein
MALAASTNVSCDHAASCDTAAVASTEAAYALPEATFWQYQRREEQILQLRQNVLSKRSKRKHYPPPPPPPPPWTVRATPPPLPEETVRRERARHAWYQQRQKEVVAQSERLLEQYRNSRRHYWAMQRAAVGQPAGPLAPNAAPFGSLRTEHAPRGDTNAESVLDDAWMQCLECAHVGVPSLSHFLSTDHRFGTCQVYATGQP